ncbi:MAG: TolC family protein [Candidatus Omnitrophota bacterium]|nr:TolC family protein [Candidatus Omnitrophota bacterium]
MRKTASLIILLFTFIVCPALLAEEISLTLDEALQIALRDNRGILLKTEDVKKAKLKIGEAQSGLYPTLDFTGGWKYTSNYYAKDLGQNFTQFSLKQYLYKGGKTINTIRQNADKLEVTQALLDRNRIELILNVQKAFNLVLLAEEFAKLNKQILDNTKMHLELVQAKFQKGETSQSDILKVQESLAGVEEAYTASVNQVESGQALLKELLYLDEKAIIKPRGQFIYEPKEVAYDEAFLKAMQNRPEIKQYAAQQRSDKRAIEIAKADSRPNIYFSWDYYTNSASGVIPTAGWEDHNAAGFTFTWPIFDGWATKSKVEQAIVDLKETQLTKEKVKKDIALELKDAYLALRDAIVKIRAVESEVTLYDDNFVTAQDQYQKGIASSLDLSDADLKKQVAFFNRNEAIYDYLVAWASFDKATGGI